MMVAQNATTSVVSSNTTTPPEPAMVLSRLPPPMSKGTPGLDLDILDARVGHQRVEFDRHVDLARVERGHRAAAGDDAFEPPPAQHAAAVLRR